MPIHNIMCPICTEIYTNSDDVHSTSCGHIFHYSCLNAWIRRENNCPQCRHLNPSVYKLHLGFEESEENVEAQEEIQLKLTSSDEKIKQLKDQLAEAESEFLKLQEQCTAAENSKLELEEKFSQMNDLENDFLRLQAEYTDSSELVKDLEDRLNQLFIEHECKLDELRRAKIENDSLKATLGKKQSSLSDDMLTEKLNILEQKLKHISAEFESEIKTSTQLSIEKMKLQARISVLNSKTQNKEVLKEPQDKGANMPNRVNMKKVHAPNKASKENFKPSDDTSNVVLIKQVPLNQITKPLETVILKMAADMQVSISLNDLIKVQLLSSSNMNPKSAQLIVQFKSSKIKDLFISSKNRFKASSLLKNVTMDDMDELFIYAQRKLLNTDFSDISCENYKILARDATGKVKYIQSKTHVDQLTSKKEY